MSPKPTSSFRRVPSIVQIAVVDVLIIWGLSSLVMAVWNTIKPGTFGEMSLRGIGNWVWFLLGLALFAWMLREIFKPRIKDESWSPVNVGIFPGVKYGFPSTHPSYVLVDLVAASATAFLLWYAVSGGYEAKQFKVMFAVSLVVPVLRLAAWFVFGLRLEGDQAWKPVAWFVIPVFAVFAIIGIAGFASGKKQQAEIANLPVIDQQTFSDSRSAFAKLAGSSQQSVETGFVRLRALQISDGPTQCKNNSGVDFATVLAGLGAGGDVLIVGANYSRLGFDELVKKSADNKGKIIEVVGKLREMKTGPTDSWKVYCGMDKLLVPPAGGRWVLEMHEP